MKAAASRHALLDAPAQVTADRHLLQSPISAVVAHRERLAGVNGAVVVQDEKVSRTQRYLTLHPGELGVEPVTSDV